MIPLMIVFMFLAWVVGAIQGFIACLLLQRKEKNVQNNKSTT